MVFYFAECRKGATHMMKIPGKMFQFVDKRGPYLQFLSTSSDWTETTCVVAGSNIAMLFRCEHVTGLLQLRRDN